MLEIFLNRTDRSSIFPIPIASGGTGSYAYAWSVAGGTSCPWFTSSTSSSFTYTPSSTTSNCQFTVTVTDTGIIPAHAAASGTTAQITVNPLLIVASSTPSSQNVNQGQTATISDSGASGGTPPYSYQWLATVAGGSTFTSSEADSLYSSSATTTTCSFVTSTSTPTGIYGFELHVADSAQTPETITSSTASVNVESTTITSTTSTTVLLDCGVSFL